MANRWNCGPSDGRQPCRYGPIACATHNGRHDGAAIKPSSDFHSAVAADLSRHLHRPSEDMEIGRGTHKRE